MRRKILPINGQLKCTGTVSILGCGDEKDEDEFLHYKTVCIDCDLKHRRRKQKTAKSQKIDNKSLNNFINRAW